MSVPDQPDVEPWAVRPIGHLRTAYTDPASTPVQTSVNWGESGSAVLLPEFVDGVEGLDGFDHAWLLTWLGPADGPAPPVTLRQVPFLLSATGRELGLFAMRGPRRPNPIGLHLVRITAVTDDGFRFAGVDMVDGTPLLDVKPWAAPFDLPPDASVPSGLRNGWIDEVDLSAPHTPRSLGGADRSQR